MHGQMHPIKDLCNYFVDTVVVGLPTIATPTCMLLKIRAIKIFGCQATTKTNASTRVCAIETHLCLRMRITTILTMYSTTVINYWHAL